MSLWSSTGHDFFFSRTNFHQSVAAAALNQVVKTEPPEMCSQKKPGESSKSLPIMKGFIQKYMDVAENRGFPPKSSNFNRVVHYKPSILGYPYFWKHPYIIYPQKAPNPCSRPGSLATSTFMLNAMDFQGWTLLTHSNRKNEHFPSRLPEKFPTWPKIQTKRSKIPETRFTKKKRVAFMFLLGLKRFPKIKLTLWFFLKMLALKLEFSPSTVENQNVFHQPPTWSFLIFRQASFQAPYLDSKNMSLCWSELSDSSKSFTSIHPVEPRKKKFDDGIVVSWLMK